MVPLVVLAWTNRNLVDDAFIMFRYAEHFANGQGLVWNAGDRVEGYTNFLCTVALGLAMRAGLEPIAFSFAANLLSFVIALALFWLVATRALGSPWHALVAVLLLGTNFTFSSAGTQGLGTHMQTSALLGATALLVPLETASGRRAILLWAAFSLVAATAVLVRMDSVLPLAVLGVVAAALIVRPADPAPPLAARLAALLLPGGLLVGTWLAWRVGFYGSIVPNTFVVKVASIGATVAGLFYLYQFVLAYLLVPHVAIAVAALGQLRPREEWLVAVSYAIVLVWCAYVVRIGGDFIEFRFMAPVLPYLFLVIYWALLRLAPAPALRWTLLALVAIGSVHRQVAFGRTIAPNYIYEPTLAIVTVPDPSADQPTLWSQIETGRYLGRVFDHDPTVTVAIGASGVIPYYAKLGFVDIAGLNDAWVAHHGTPVRFQRYVGGMWPAHVRLATLAYLRERGVHLFVGAGALTREDYAHAVRTFGDLLLLMFDRDAEFAGAFRVTPADLPADALVVEIPVRKGYALLSLYLTRTPRIDTVIATHGWRTYPVHQLAS
jgi:arabinofuranosyltransferase